MAELTLREAARQVGVSRQSIYRMVKDGRLTATVRHDGQKVVDTAELLRAFGSLSPRQSPETVTQGDSPRQPATVTPIPPPARDAMMDEMERRRDADRATLRDHLQAMTADERRREVEIADREALRAELAAARDALRRAEEQLAEAREREAKLMDLAQSATRLLEHREVQAQPPKGFWRRVFGG